MFTVQSNSEYALVKVLLALGVKIFAKRHEDKRTYCISTAL